MQPGVSQSHLLSVPYMNSILHYDNRCAKYEEGGNTCPLQISRFPYECETYGPPDPSGNRNRIAGRQGFPFKYSDVVEVDGPIVVSGTLFYSPFLEVNDEWYETKTCDFKQHKVYKWDGVSWPAYHEVQCRKPGCVAGNWDTGNGLMNSRFNLHSNNFDHSYLGAGKLYEFMAVDLSKYEYARNYASNNGWVIPSCFQHCFDEILAGRHDECSYCGTGACCKPGDDRNKACKLANEAGLTQATLDHIMDVVQPHIQELQYYTCVEDFTNHCECQDFDSSLSGQYYVTSTSLFTPCPKCVNNPYQYRSNCGNAESDHASSGTCANCAPCPDGMIDVPTYQWNYDLAPYDPHCGTQCVSCPIGKYAPNPDENNRKTTCLQCGENKYLKFGAVQEGDNQCLKCTEGTSSPGAYATIDSDGNIVTGCSTCDVGKYDKKLKCTRTSAQSNCADESGCGFCAIDQVNTVATNGAVKLELNQGVKYVANSKSNDYCTTCDKFFGAHKFQGLNYLLAETLESSWTWYHFLPGYTDGYDYTDRYRYYSQGGTWETRNQPWPPATSTYEAHDFCGYCDDENIDKIICSAEFHGSSLGRLHTEEESSVGLSNYLKINDNGDRVANGKGTEDLILFDDQHVFYQTDGSDPIEVTSASFKEYANESFWIWSIERTASTSTGTFEKKLLGMGTVRWYYSHSCTFKTTWKRYTRTNRDQCQKCEDNQISQPGGTECKTCATNSELYYVDYRGEVLTRDNPEEDLSDRGFAQCRCKPEYWGNALDSSVGCTACPTGKTTTGTKRDLVEDCICADGTCDGSNANGADANDPSVVIDKCNLDDDLWHLKFRLSEVDLTNSQCYNCPSGYYSIDETYNYAPDVHIPNQRRTCRKCEVGKKWVSSKLCEYCESGKYQDEEGQTECKSCIFGKQKRTDTDNLDPRTEDGTCEDCGLNKEPKNDVGIYCSPCPHGKEKQYSGPADKTNVCVDCEAGKSRVGDEPGCTVCGQTENGQWQRRNPNTGLCELCPAGTSSKVSNGKTCDECPAGQEKRVQNSILNCYDCHENHYSNADTNSICKKCPAGKYQTEQGKSSCNDCEGCPHQYYRNKCGFFGGIVTPGTCEPCEPCSAAEYNGLYQPFIRVGCRHEKGYSVTDLDESAKGRCIPAKLATRTPLCQDEGQQGTLGLGGFSYRELFNVDKTKVPFQCRELCDGEGDTIFDENELIGNSEPDSFKALRNGEGLDSGYCDGPFACNVLSCVMEGDSQEFQHETRTPYACPVELPEYMRDVKNLTQYASIIEERRKYPCQTCAECGSRRPNLATDWGRGCARECSQLLCEVNQIYDWTDHTCKRCIDLQDPDLCTTEDRLGLQKDGGDISGNRPKIVFDKCVAKPELTKTLAISYGTCRLCEDDLTMDCPDGEYHVGCDDAASTAGSCAACYARENLVLSTQTYLNATFEENPVYCQLKRCSPTRARPKTGVSDTGDICHRDCVQQTCDAGEYPLPCVLPHDARCVPEFPKKIHNTLKLIDHVPIHANLLEPVNDIHFFSNFENILINLHAENDHLHQCVWNARDIRDNDVNPGGISMTFYPPQNTYASELQEHGSKFCHHWTFSVQDVAGVRKRNSITYPMLPLQNTVSYDDDEISSRRVLVNTSTRVMRYMDVDENEASRRGYTGQGIPPVTDDVNAVSRPNVDAGSFVGDLYMNMDLTNIFEAHLMIPVRKDRIPDSALEWVPQFQVSVFMKQTSKNRSAIQANVKFADNDKFSIDINLLQIQTSFSNQNGVATLGNVENIVVENSPDLRYSLSNNLDQYKLFTVKHDTIGAFTYKDVYVISHQISASSLTAFSGYNRYFLRHFPHVLLGSPGQMVQESNHQVIRQHMLSVKETLVSVAANTMFVGKFKQGDIVDDIHTSYQNKIKCFAHYASNYQVLCLYRSVDSDSEQPKRIMQYDIRQCPYLKRLIEARNNNGRHATIAKVMPFFNILDTTQSEYNSFFILVNDREQHRRHLIYVESSYVSSTQLFNNKPVMMQTFTENQIMDMSYQMNYFWERDVSSIHFLEVQNAENEYSFIINSYDFGLDFCNVPVLNQQITCPRFVQKRSANVFNYVQITENEHFQSPLEWPSNAFVMSVSDEDRIFTMLALPQLGASGDTSIVLFSKIFNTNGQLVCGANIHAPEVFQRNLLHAEDNYYINSIISKAWIDTDTVVISYFGYVYELSCQASGQIEFSELSDSFLRGYFFERLLNSFLTFNITSDAVSKQKVGNSLCEFGYEPSKTPLFFKLSSQAQSIIETSHDCAVKCSFDDECSMYYYTSKQLQTCSTFTLNEISSWSETNAENLDKYESTMNYEYEYTCVKNQSDFIMVNDEIYHSISNIEILALLTDTVKLEPSDYTGSRMLQLNADSSGFVAEHIAEGFVAFEVGSSEQASPSIYYRPIPSVQFAQSSSRKAITQVCVSSQCHTLHPNEHVLHANFASISAIELFDTAYNTYNQGLDLSAVTVRLQKLNRKYVQQFFSSNSALSHMFVYAVFQLQCGGTLQIQTKMFVNTHFTCSRDKSVVVVVKVDRAILTAVDFLDENTKVSMYEFEINEVVEHALGVYSQTLVLFELGHKTSLNMLQADTQEWSLAQIYSLIQDSELNVHPVNVHSVSQNWKQIKQNFKAHVLQQESFIKLQLQRDLSEKRSKDQAIMKSASVAVDAVQIIPVLTLDHCGLFCGTESSEARTNGNRRRLLQADAEFVTVCGKYGDAERVNVDIKVKTQESTTVFTSHDVTLIDVSNNTIQKWDVLGLTQWVLGQPGFGCSDTCSSTYAQDGIVTNARFTCVESFPFLSSYYANQIIRQITGQSCSDACSSWSCDNLHWTPALFDNSGSFQCMHMTPVSFSTCNDAQPGWRRLCPCGLPAFCPVNHYYDQSNSNLCVSCPEGKFTEAIIGKSNVGIESCSCDVGYEERVVNGHVICHICSPGTHKDIKGSSSCKSCESGKFALQDGSVDENVCIERDACQPGQYRISETECLSCEAGKFSVVLDANECTYCPGGKIAANTGTQTCSECPAGSYSSPDRTQCISCGPNGYGITSNAGSASESDCVCMAGREPSDTTSNLCVACVAGKYKPAIGNNACLSCSYSGCADGTYLINCDGTLAGSCTSCEAGKISASGDVTCTACAAGKKESGHTTCQDCETGKYSEYQASVCTDCEQGKYTSSTASVQCTDCAAGKKSAAVGASSESTCSACLAHEYSNVGSASCTSCTTEEATCAANGGQHLIGYYLTGCGGATAGTCAHCGNCESNQFKANCGPNDSGSCTECAQGTYSSGIHTSCWDCELGKYRTSSQDECTWCPSGKFASATPIGQSGCQSCASGKWSTANRQACAWPCELGEYMVSGNGWYNCEACGGGYYGTDGIVSKSKCTSCQSGKVQDQEVASTCTSCVAGKYANEVDEPCEDCEVGKYNANADQTICDLCAAGTFLASTGSTTSSDCTSCDAGKISAEGASACTTCSSGKFADGSATSCLECTSGSCSAGTETSCANGVKSCTACASGKYKSSDGTETCSDCPPALTCPSCSNGETACGGSTPGHCNYPFSSRFKNGDTVWKPSPFNEIVTVQSDVTTTCLRDNQGYGICRREWKFDTTGQGIIDTHGSYWSADCRTYDTHGRLNCGGDCTAETNAQSACASESCNNPVPTECQGITDGDYRACQCELFWNGVANEWHTNQCPR